MEKNINEIKTKNNIRKELGDLTELSNSIKEHGILQPIIINKENEILLGHRRYEASKKIGLKTIPVIIQDLKGEQIIEAQLIENLQRKDLNLIEEATALQEYLNKHKKNIEFLSKRLGKTKKYVERRLLLNKLSDEIKEKLKKGTLMFGHGLLLAKLPEPKAKEYSKDIINQDYSVTEAKERLQYENFTKTISRAPFNKSDCKDCKWNGSIQSELFETGKTLNGKCLNESCYLKKLKAYIKEVKIKFKDCLWAEDSERYSVPTPKGFVEGDYEYRLKEAGITKAYLDKCREEKNPETYKIYIDEGGEIKEYFFKKKKSDKGKSLNEIQEKQKNKDRAEYLKMKVREWKREWLINISEKLLKPNLNMLKVTLWELREKYGDMSSSTPTKKYFDMTDKEVMKEMRDLSQHIFQKMDYDSLKIASTETGVVAKEHFEMNVDYLRPYVKTQLIKLAKEHKIDLAGCHKNTEIKDRIVKLWKKGEVPKEMIK